MLTPVKAIRKKCLECSGNSYNEVRFCHMKRCPLYEYRFGRRPTKEERCEKKEAAIR